MKTEKSCGAIVFKKENDEFKFLIVQERIDHGGHWNFPKGHTENNETEKETIHRELMEEINLKIEILDDFREKIFYEVARNNSKKTVAYFLAIPKTEKIKLQKSELENFVWLNYEDCLERLTFDNSKELFKKAYNFLKSNI